MTDETALDGGSTEAAEVGAASPASGVDAGLPAEEAVAQLDPGDASLLALIDRLGSLLDRSDLSELAVESGGTRVVLRKPAAVAALLGAGAGAVPTPGGEGGPASTATTAGTPPGVPAATLTDSAAPGRPSVKAPLTGVWYGSPAPGSAPFVAVGREVAVGQVIGLIEAMKLFNEIKSDLAGRVARVFPESGALVKAKQPLIEVEPL
ncbi:MAG TPA: acetyl-CoA carboxylase biotin carboxyl carrier protein subunit [Candidatus Limnocylindrales bacterium]|nr:acetyl-CoA carboxylase biotin carboxyl carrier protein subunit [Candidatus Limnocylindrales bacterium]